MYEHWYRLSTRKFYYMSITTWFKRVVKSLHKHITNLDNNLTEPADELLKQRYRVIFKAKVLWNMYILFTKVSTIQMYFSLENLFSI